MTNEKIAEEIWYKAHEFGFVENLKTEITNLMKETKPHTPYSEIVYDAYINIKQTLNVKELIE